jgi:hypothetical protein
VPISDLRHGSVQRAIFRATYRRSREATSSGWHRPRTRRCNALRSHTPPAGSGPQVRHPFPGRQVHRRSRKPATGTLVFIDDGHPFVGECHDGWESAGLVSALATAGYGGGSSSVMPRLIANRVTAVSSVTADTGRICHAARRLASYAGTSEATRSRQPRFRIAREAHMSRLLYSSRIPQNAGKTLWPIAKTIVERNPTVSAWREAPQTPPWVSASAAYTPREAAMRSQTYDPRTNAGNDEETPSVLAGFLGRPKTPKETVARMLAINRSAVAIWRCPISAAARPDPETAKAAISPRLDGSRRPRKTGSHLALNPHTANTGKPQAARNR